MANGSLAHERGMVWLRAVLELDDDVRRLIVAAELGCDEAVVVARPGHLREEECL